MLKRGYQDLQVWQKAMELVNIVYDVTDGFPKHELYGLRSQITRAAVSIPSNLAEGATRTHTKDFLRFVDYSRASLAEVETQMMIAITRRYITNEKNIEQFDSLAVEVGKMLNGLMNSLKTKPTDN